MDTYAKTIDLADALERALRRDAGEAAAAAAIREADLAASRVSGEVLATVADPRHALTLGEQARIRVLRGALRACR